MLWPQHALTLTTPELVLRGTSEADAFALAEIVPADVAHDPRLPDVPAPQKVLLKYWQNLGGWQVDKWSLWFTVTHEGRPLGVQTLKGQDFLTLRTVDSWSWLVPSARERGFGKQMRTAVLSLAFEHLGAVRAISGAWQDNAPSLGVSRALGYADNGVDLMKRNPDDGGGPEGGVGRMQRIALERADFTPACPVTVTGIEPCLTLFGL